MYTLDNEQVVQEYLVNSKVAFSNKQFNESLEWVQKALNSDSNNVLANSQAGVVSVVLKQFDNALKYFQKAVDLEPNNGDNLFNLGNAYFFMKDYNNALKCYSKADTLGCSENAKAKLYYQMAVICSVSGDVQSALVNYQKYEDCNQSNGVNADIIAEKVRLYLVVNDLDNALKCASQLVLVAPKDFKSYDIYFRVLLASQSYSKADSVLDEATKYANLDQSDRVTLQFNRVALYTAQAEHDTELASTYYSKALEILKLLEDTQGLEKSQLDRVRVTSAEVYLKLERFDEAIECVHRVRGLDECEESTTTDAEYYNMVDVDSMADSIEEKIYSGEIDVNELENAEIEYDENGYERRVIREGVFGNLSADNDTVSNSVDTKERKGISRELNDSLRFILLSCYAEKEEYSKALAYARALKHNVNPYYAYYGTYVEAYSMKQLSLDGWKSAYDEAIAFFRTRMMKVSSDRLAVVFRARLYAENGKFSKALEMVKLLPNDTKESVLKYIEKYQREYQCV